MKTQPLESFNGNCMKLESTNDTSAPTILVKKMDFFLTRNLKKEQFMVIF